jgi:anti-anti-sigma regulatory factor
MPWTVEPTAGTTELALTGQVDIFEAAALHALVVDLARRPSAVHVDLRACEDLDASAIQLLHAFRRAGGDVTLSGGTGRVGQLLARFGLAADGGGRQA